MPQKPLQLAVGLDAGSSRTRCIVCALDGDRIRYLGHGLAPAAGWNRGRIVDQDALAESIHAAITDAQRGSRVAVEAVTAGIGGSEIRGAQSRGLYEFGRPREIDHTDMAYVVEMASEVRLERGRMLLQVLPQDFILDGRAGYRRPHKGICSRLEANVHVITGSSQEHLALVASHHLAHLAVEETVFEPLASAYACVLPADRERGVAVLDIGFNSSGMAIYDGDRMLLASSLPVGGDHFTRDVAAIFKVDYEDAECLKQQYGCALLGLTADFTLIEVPTPEGRPAREARRSELIEILEARAEELFLYVRAELQRAGMERSLGEGIVLTGGGALLNGMCDMAERILNCPARNGLTQGIADWPDELESPVWAASAGLAMYSAKLKLHRPPQRRAKGLMGLVTK